MMVDKGVMQEIREHLTQGKSSHEVIALGYAPGSVYKVQRQLRRHGSAANNLSAPVRLEEPASAPHPDILARLEKLEAANDELSAQVTELLAEKQTDSILESQIDQLGQRVERLVSEVAAVNKEASLKANEQQGRIALLEQQTKTLEEVVALLVPLMYHLDIHHRTSTHGWLSDPADQEFGPSDVGYKALLQALRQMLSQNDGLVRQCHRFSLPVQLRGILSNYKN
jgi:septal ring factor EnvC (AmiA/AmiB activator)